MKASSNIDSALASMPVKARNSAEQLDLMLGILEVISQAAAEGLKKHVA